MAKFYLQDCALRVDGIIRQDVVDSVTLQADVAALDVTTFGSGGYRERIGGLRSSAMQMTGFEDFAGAEDPYSAADEWFVNLGGVTPAATEIYPDPSGSPIAVGDTAFFTTVHRRSLRVGGSVGSPYKFDVQMGGTDWLVRGQAEVASTDVTSAGHDSAGVQLGALSASQKIFYIVSVEAVNTAGTVTWNLQSDDNGSFTSATTQATGGVSSVGGTFGSVAGAITDDYWRFNFTAAGGTDLTISACFGIA